MKKSETELTEFLLAEIDWLEYKMDKTRESANFYNSEYSQMAQAFSDKALKVTELQTENEKLKRDKMDFITKYQKEQKEVVENCGKNKLLLIQKTSQLENELSDANTNIRTKYTFINILKLQISKTKWYHLLFNIKP